MVFMTTHIQEEEEEVIWTKSKRTALFPQENIPKKDHKIAIAQTAAGELGCRRYGMVEHSHICRTGDDDMFIHKMFYRLDNVY